MWTNNRGGRIKVRAGVKAGGVNFQHSRKVAGAGGVRVRAGVKAGGTSFQHNRKLASLRRRG